MIDPDAIMAALKRARKELAAANRDALLRIYTALGSDVPYEVNEAQVGNGRHACTLPHASPCATRDLTRCVHEPQVGARRLRNTCLAYLSKLGGEQTTSLCLEQFRTAGSMTDSVAALASLAPIAGPARDEAMEAFYSRAKANKEALVINKWLSVQAMADTPDALEEVKALMEHEAYDGNNPNSIRSLLNTFAAGSPAARTSQQHSSARRNIPMVGAEDTGGGSREQPEASCRLRG